jgi:hypothetical protein
MPDESPTVVQFHYIKSNAFRVIHTDGAIGHITPAGLIFVGLYSERAPIPKMMAHEITDAGQVGTERQEQRVSKTGIVREIEVGAMMGIDTAKRLVQWLQERIELAQKLKTSADQRRSKDAVH